MKNDKKALKVLKKGFTIDEWENFSFDLKSNQLIISELVKKMDSVGENKIRELCDQYPFIIRHMRDKMQIMIVNNDNFRFLNDDLQMQVVEKNHSKIKYASDAVQVKFATNNPEYLSFLSKSNQLEMIEGNEFFLEYASKEIQVECAKKDIDMLCYCSNDVQYAFVKKDPNNYNRCNYEVRKKIIYLDDLDPNKISVETLENYLSNHYDNLSLEELERYKNKIRNSTREDSSTMGEYIDYLLINLERRKYQ